MGGGCPQESQEHRQPGQHHRGIKGTKTELTTGPIDFTTPANPTTLHVTPNVCKQVVSLGQVVKSTGGKWLYDLPIVAAIDAPASVTTIDPVPIKYA